MIVDWKSIEKAEKRLRPYVLKTPLFYSHYLSKMNQGRVFLKLESEQYTGSFKARGALNFLMATQRQHDQQFIAASTGNHAQGFARGLDILHTSGLIVMPENASLSKIKALEHYPVTIKQYGSGALEAELHAKKLAETDGHIFVSPYNDQLVIAGQGTLAVEVTEDLPEVDTVIGCIGGGGMMSGVGLWLKNIRQGIQVIGALPDRSPEMYLSMKEDRIVVLEEQQDTLSDGSAGGLEPGSITFDICKEVVDQYLTVSEDEIIEGIRWMAENHHKMIEGSAAVALMAFISNVSDFKGKNVVIIICGANIDTKTFASILDGSYPTE